MHTITSRTNGAKTHPVAVEGYTTRRAGRNVIHDTLDGGIGVSKITPRPRSGTLTLVYGSEALANEAFELLALNHNYVYTTDARAFIGMLFIVNDLEVEYDATYNVFRVQCEYQEIGV